jgi:hypothetical protein
VIAAIVAWLGTPLLFYMYVAPPMSHATSAFTVAAFVWCWLVVRERWTVGGALALGALGGLMAMVREQDAFFVAGPALDFALTAWRRPTAVGDRLSRLISRGLAAGVGFALAALPQAVAYLRLNGRLGPSPLVSRKMTWSAPHALEVITSPEHGFFIWTPLALVALAGLAWMAVARPPVSAGAARDRRRIGVCMLLMVALQVYVAGSVESWSVAGAFGQRRFVALTVLLAVGLAALWQAAWRPLARRLLALTLAVGLWWNIALIVQFATNQMDRQRLEPGRIAYNTFVVVPRDLPRLLYRYIFDRQSFYDASLAPSGAGR